MGDETDSSVGSDDDARDRFREWVLLDGDRIRVAGSVVVVSYLFLVAMSVSGLVPYANVRPLYYAYSGLISGNLTLITVVVAINQLLLSREFHTPGELESQIEGVEAYRSEAGSITGRVVPIDPPGFLRLLVESSRQQAQEVGGLARSEASDDLCEDLDPIVTELTAQADAVTELIRESETTTFEALAATLTTNYAPQINGIRRVEHEHAPGVPEDVVDAFDELVRRLKDVDVARQYFKTLYLQEELATLSRQLFYVGLVSIPTVVCGLLILTASPGASVPVRQLRFLAPTILSVGLAPLSLLFAFIVRVATVTQRTVSTIPFTTSVQER